jgi:hypothetical protein
MNIVNYEKYVHIYSLPWPSTKDDQRDGSIKSDVKICRYMRDVIINKVEEFSELERYYPRVRQLTTCLSIDIELPLRIFKLIFSERTRKYDLSNKTIVNNVILVVSSLDNVVQPSIRHLVVKCHLTDIDQLLKLAHQFPHVNYFELLFTKYFQS